MGGALAMGGLAASKDIAAGAAIYGVNFGLFETDALAHKPVQGHFGMEDKMEGFSDPATGSEARGGLMKAAGNANAEVFLYEGVGHAFMNESPKPFASFADRQEKMRFPPYDAKTRQLWRGAASSSSSASTSREARMRSGPERRWYK